MNYPIIITRTLFHFVSFLCAYYVIYTIAQSLGYHSVGWLSWQFVFYYLFIFIGLAIMQERRQTKPH